MGEALNGLKRTMMCGEPREEHVGKKITLMGWVQRNRKLGGLEFIDLRDKSGIMQVVFGEEINAEAFEHFVTRRFVNKLISSGRDFVFGSDAHNLDDRKPNFDLIAKRSGSENIRRSDKVLMSAMADEERMFAF